MSIEDYTRPARMVENGRFVKKPALSGPELIDFPGIGTLEAFNTDGLRTLVDTVEIPNMKEKTLRFPGHAEKMRILRETGFFSYDPIDVNGVEVRPIDVTARLLFPFWEMKEGDRDFTVMRVEVAGKRAVVRLSACGRWWTITTRRQVPLRWPGLRVTLLLLLRDL